VLDQEALEGFRTAPFDRYCREFIRIVNKRREVVPFEFNLGQATFEEMIQERYVALGKPVRAIILKARQIGFSTQTQARMIRDLTLNGNRRGVVVAHELDAAGGLFEMGQSMYARLPDDAHLKPPTRYITRGRRLHFAPPERDAWMGGDLWPDSLYQVDTANEAEGGRSKTYDYLHLSEVAFWANAIDKLIGLLQTVPDEPGTWIILESTANGTNLFKDEWDKAVRGDSDYLPFFWPWWKEPTYRVELTEAEAANFRPGTGAFGEGERELLDPGPVDYFTGEHVPLTLEQLAWRRATIKNKCLGKLDKFQQEYPATPQEAFLASGRHVFDQKKVAQILVRCDISDPALPTEENPGPFVGGFEATKTKTVSLTHGTLEVPEEVVWAPDTTREPWKLWLPRGADGKPELEMPGTEKDRDRGQKPRRQFVIGADASGGRMSEGATETDYQAAQIIDHRTLEQVARFRSHDEPAVYARELYMAAHFLSGGNPRTHGPWIGVEVTGGWGLPIVRALYFDYSYPWVYIRTRLDGRNDTEDDRLGWNTGPNTKPILEALGMELLREDADGLKDRETALEMTSFVRDDRGRTGAEPGRHDDLLMAWLVAQQIAREEALRPEWWGKGAPAQAAPPGYDLYR
jgi:hypothetical protein